MRTTDLGPKHPRRANAVTSPSRGRGQSTAPEPVASRGADFSAVPSVTSRGASLPGALRRSLEGYFNTSLHGVAVHSDPASQATAGRLDAAAYTVGQDIHLGAVGVRATGPARDRLLAHEVVHTLQQQRVRRGADPKAGRPGDALERQADALSHGFARFGRDSEDSVALQIRDRVRLRQVTGDAPLVQCSKVRTHFGEFEDVNYSNLIDTAGNEVGVDMRLKFHPGDRARADGIGLTQAAQGTLNGVPITDGIFGVHSAAAGAGTGRFIDRREGSVNPLYGTTNTVKAGGSATKLGDYEARPPTTFTAAQQAADAAAIGVSGRTGSGGSTQGFRKVVNGVFVTQPAEMHDAPMLHPHGPNSLQVFETTALAVSGSQAGTYYGSVEWGWTRDAKGAFARKPFRVLAQGIPTVEFLTAASIWNPSKASFGFVTTAATDLLSQALARISTIPANTALTPTGRQGAQAGVTYVEVTHGGNTGFVANTAVRPAAIGGETVDLPVPVVYRVTNAAGTTMLLDASDATRTVFLPAGTRVRGIRCMVPRGILTNHDEVEVVDGPRLGTRGFVLSPDIAVERLGTR